MFRLWVLAEQVPQARYRVTALIDSGREDGGWNLQQHPRDERIKCSLSYLAEVLTDL